MLNGPGLLPHSGKKARKLVVFCHGYGSNGQDLLNLARYWSKLMPDTEFLAPNAPEAWEEAPALGYQWFSLEEFTPSYVRQGLDKTRPFLQAYLQEMLLERGLNPKDLAIVGFSQGGMMALEMMFAMKDVRGLVCYSGGFYPALKTSLSKPLPEVLLVHGDMDTIVPYTAFLEAQQQLKQLGLNPQTLTCSGLGHSIDEEGLKVGGKFLTSLFEQDH